MWDVFQNYLSMRVRDLPGAEGPVVDRDGRLFIVSPSRGHVLEVLESTVRIHASTGGRPAGLQVDQSNRLWVADMALGVMLVLPGGEVRAAVTSFAGQPMRGCNDLTFDDHGDLYITAPAGSNAAKPTGEFYRLTPDGECTRMDGGFAFSNGIAIDPAGRTLIVAETATNKLWAYDIDPHGCVQHRRLFANVPGEPPGPDGLDFDADGRLLVANWRGRSIDVFDAEGTLIRRCEVPFNPSNLHFGGSGRMTLYITEHTNNALWQTRWPTPGKKEWGLQIAPDSRQVITT